MKHPEFVEAPVSGRLSEPAYRVQTSRSATRGDLSEFAGLLRCLQPAGFPFWPFCVEGVAARLGPGEDRLPRLDRVGDSALAFEQECAAVERTDVVGVEFERVGPVGERAVGVAGCRL